MSRKDAEMIFVLLVGVFILKCIEFLFDMVVATWLAWALLTL